GRRSGRVLGLSIGGCGWRLSAASTATALICWCRSRGLYARVAGCGGRGGCGSLCATTTATTESALRWRRYDDGRSGIQLCAMLGEHFDGFRTVESSSKTQRCLAVFGFGCVGIRAALDQHFHGLRLTG